LLSWLDEAGMGLITPAEGMRALDELLSRPVRQLVFLKTKKPWHALSREAELARSAVSLTQSPIRSHTEGFTEGPDERIPASASRKDLSSLKDRGSAYFRALVGKFLNIPAQQILPGESLANYGIDSILAEQIATALAETFTDVRGTLLFEHPTVEALLKHFLATQPERLRKAVGDVAEDRPRMAAARAAPKVVSQASAEIDVQQRSDRPRVSLESGRDASRDIAVVAMSGRFPKAATVDELWRLLRNGEDGVTEVPSSRWDHSAYFDRSGEEVGKVAGKWGGFIDGVAQFDPLFFNIAPSQAELMDPQERLFMQVVWQLLENGAYTRQSLQESCDGKVGVYVGATSRYYGVCESDPVSESAAAISSYAAIANRVSHFFGFSGPSMAVDTMCSSSAVAIHCACKDLLVGDCTMAVVGGVNLQIHPKKYVGLGLAQFLGSRVGSRSFSDGDGFIPAESIAAVLLTTVEHARACGQRILAVIKATGTNHVARAQAYTVPDPGAQARLMEETLAKGRIDPRTVSYIEAAANGSGLGDSIEFTALKKVFASMSPEGPICTVGTVKSNLGHAEAATGITQLIKVVLQLQHHALAPTIHARPLNPNIDFSGTGLQLQEQLVEWRRPVPPGARDECPRRALINSVGAGGSNAVIVVEESPSREALQPVLALPGGQLDPVAQRELIVFSARTPERLATLVGLMRTDLAERSQVSLGDLAHTLQIGREALEVRVAFLVMSTSELLVAMDGFLEHATATSPAALSPNTFVGDEATAHGNQGLLRNLLDGAAGEMFVRTLLDAGDLERIALFWTHGGVVPWESVGRADRRRMYGLPTYPFEAREYWLPRRAAAGPGVRTVQQAIPTEASTNSTDETAEEIEKWLTLRLAAALKVNASEIDRNRDLQDYGVESIVALRMMRGFEAAFGIKMSGRELLAHRTLKALSRSLVGRLGNEHRGRDEHLNHELSGASA
jgi:acyl transferase domain-containing protein